MMADALALALAESERFSAEFTREVEARFAVPHVARPKSDVIRVESSIAAISSSEGRRAKRLAASRTRAVRGHPPY